MVRDETQREILVESVEGMRAVIERVTPNDSGRFFNFDGREIQW